MKSKITELLSLLLWGTAAGLLNGLLGAGGGVLLVLGLRRLGGSRIGDPRSIYAGVTAVMLPLSLFSLYRYRAGGHLPHGALSLLLFPALIGGAVGALLLRRIRVGLLNRLFALLVLLSGALLALR